MGAWNGPRRILVTGAGGFIGSRIATELGRMGAVVLDARRLAGGADLLDAEACAQAVAAAAADTLIHTAWVTAHGSFWASPLNAAWEAASADLFARFAAAGGRRILGLGSVAEYDWTTGAAALGEDAPLAPATPYGAAKARTAEALARLSAREGLSHAWARVFFTFGPGEAPARLVPAIIRATCTGQPLDCGPAALARDFLGVEALGATLARLGLAEIEGPVNVASGRAVRLDQIGAVVGAALGRAAPLRLGARPLGPGEPMALVADTARLAAAGLAPAEDLGASLAAYARALCPAPVAR